MPLSEKDRDLLLKFKDEILSKTDATFLIPSLCDGGILKEEDILTVRAERENGIKNELEKLIELYSQNAENLEALARSLEVQGLYDLTENLGYSIPQPKSPGGYQARKFKDDDVVIMPFSYVPESGTKIIGISQPGTIDDRSTESYDEIPTTATGPLIVALGGHGVADSLEYYEPFSKPLPLASSRWGHLASPFSSKRIIMVGGCDENHNFSDSTDIFDPESCEWRKGPPMTIGRSQACGAVLKERLFVFGGLGERSSEYLDFDRKKWIQTLSLPKKRWGSVAVTLGDVIYMAGGRVGGPAVSSSVEVFSPEARYSWYLARSLPAARTEFAACAINNCMIVSGGMDQRGRNLDDCQMFDPREGLWHSAGPMNNRRSAHVIVTCGSRVLAMGGAGHAYRPMSSVEEFEIRKNSWMECRGMLAPRQTFAAATS